MRIDINSDTGESFGAYTSGHDAGLFKSITSANVAAGFHAGDPWVLRDTIRLANKHGVAVGAHPGFPDLVGFGRREVTGAVSPFWRLALKDYSSLVVSVIGGVSARVAGRGLDAVAETPSITRLEGSRWRGGRLWSYKPGSPMLARPGCGGVADRRGTDYRSVDDGHDACVRNNGIQRIE